MTITNIIFETKMRLSRSSATTSLDELTLLIIFNAALQRCWRWTLQWDPTWHYKSSSFASTASLAKPADFWKVLAIKATGATFGSVRVSTIREFDEIEGNTYISGRASLPNALVGPSNIEITPATAGILYYIRKIGEITDLTYDITAIGVVSKPALIPWYFEEVLILEIMRLALVRELQKPDMNPTEVMQRTKVLNDTVAALHKAFKPLNITDTDVLTPPVAFNK